LLLRHSAFSALGPRPGTTREHLRREGKIALIGILVSTKIGGVSTVYDFETAQKTAAVKRRKSD
jgi:hypothetical protein